MEGNFYSFVYDPVVMGYNTSKWWKSVTNAPSFSSPKIISNNDEMIMIPSFSRGKVDFELIVPVGPTAGDVRRWGLYNLSKGAGAYFQVTDTDFKATVTDGESFTENVTLTWSTAWTADKTKFSVQVEAGLVNFYIDDVLVTTVDIGGSELTRWQVSPWVKNTNADDLEVHFVSGEALQGYSEPIV